MARYLSPLDVWAIAFGCMVGWGAFVMPSTTFLPIAGPAGAVIVMVLSTIVVLVIGRNFGFLMARRPSIGGIYSYTKEAFGRDHAFLSSWFLTLSYITIVFLNATALFIIGRTMCGTTFQVGFHYQVAGYDVYFGEIALSASLLVVVGLFFILAKPVLQKLQTALAIILAGGIAIMTIAALPQLDPAVLTQLPHDAGIDPVVAVLVLVFLAPWAFVGFDIVSLETAHFKFSTKKSWFIVAVSILTAGVAYIVMMIASVCCIPDGFATWQDYISSIDTVSGLMAVPPFHAAQETMGDLGVVVAALTAVSAILTGVIGAARATVRMLSTMAEDRIISQEFKGTTFCILFIMGISILMSFLGRNALNWFVELASFGAIVGFGYVSASALRLARLENNRTIIVTGAVGAALSAVFVVVQLVSQVATIQTMSAPSFLLLSLWCLAGFVFYWRTMRQGELSEFTGVPFSSGCLFTLLFYCMLMWSTKSMRAVASNSQLDAIIVRNTIVLMLFVAVGLAVMFFIQSMLRHRHDQLKRDKIRAEESSKAKSQFLFNMSHDIRTPMNAIVVYTRLAEQQEGLDPKTREYLEKIDTSGKQLLMLIDDILEMSRIESGKMELRYAPCDLVELFTEFDHMFSLLMEEKGIHFVMDTSQVRDRRVMCDSGRLGRVLQNLLSNAHKFTPEGGSVEVVLCQHDDTDDGRASYEIRVRDNGIGMSEEFATRLFDAFERERSSTVSGIQGTGLGMAITKDIVDKMGGSIDVDTALGEGTEFTVHLELERAPEHEALTTQAQKQEEETAALDFSTMRALIVEDNDVNREILTMMLEGNGFRVDIARNGKEALEVVTQKEPGCYDIILMDVQMPVMDGYEATRAIRGLADPSRSRVPIVAVTANAFGEDVEKALAAGMDGHVAKPVDPARLVGTITEALRRVDANAARSNAADEIEQHSDKE